jgi:MazG family protein
MLIEEVYDVVEAVDDGDMSGLAGELGDLLLHVVFHAELGSEQDAFDIDGVIAGISEKLIRRHPHVFGDGEAADPEEVVRNWEAIKQKERADAGVAETSVLDGIPRRLPPLHEAHTISSRVARQGFDWPDLEGVFEKLAEEIVELRAAAGVADPDRRREEAEEEIGDLLFVVVNLARHLGVDSEAALRRSNRKFRRRFGHVEASLAREGRTPLDSTPEEMESLWQDAKRGAGKGDDET